MLQAYSTDLAVTAKQLIAFQTVEAIGTTVTATADSTTIMLNAPGVYYIAFNADGTTTEAGTFGVQMNKNGVAEPQAMASNATLAGGEASVAFSTLMSVKKSCCCQNNAVSLTFEYTGSDGTAMANVVVTKVR